MTRLRISAAVLAVLGLAFPTGPAIAKPPANRGGSLPTLSQSEAPDLGPLDGFGIPSGRCGMMLYGAAGTRSTPVFRSLDDGTATMQIEGSIVQLRLVGRGGDTRVGVPSIQYFSGVLADQSEVHLSVTTAWGKGFQAGSFVDSGTLSVTGADGWSRIMPVAGIAGCRP